MLVLSVDPWEMQDERTGESRRGLSIWYLNQYRDGELGQKPTKISASLDLMSDLRGRVPCVCDLDFGSRPGAGNKAVLTVVALDVIEEFDLVGVIQNAMKMAA
ncbi:hypothetical protein EBL85_16355 [Marichromatium sp. AB32]|nr:hypothetical protein EBL85_16355 [Marichromatium sp. AB32]